MPKHHSEDYKINAVKHYVNKSKNLSKKDHRIKMGDKVERTILYRIIPLNKIDFIFNLCRFNLQKRLCPTKMIENLQMMHIQLR
jgi:hypothetical protein